MRPATNPKISQNGTGSTAAIVHSFEPRDPIEVISPHGPGIVLYITVQGAHGNDMWCVANKEDGRIRHYESTQLKLAYNGMLGLNPPAS
jgi:hypothetical protein